MNSAIIGMLAESSIHPGAGRNEGIVDLPVAREAATDYPVIVGSSLKGALRQIGRDTWDGSSNRISRLFGEQDNAGSILVSDARLLALPVRSLTTQSMWITCPHLLERFNRDRRRSGQSPKPMLADSSLRALRSDRHQVLGPISGKPLFLEERQFNCAGPVDETVLEAVKSVIPHVETRRRVPEQLLVLSDDDFAWFARFGLSVNARNVLDEKMTSKNLWYEETIPADAIFYAVLGQRGTDALADARELLPNHSYLQVGGNSTVGQGWFAIQWLDQGGAQ